MAKKSDCCCGGKTNVVLACSGASNVGQMTNELAKRLDTDGTARFFCLAGIGGHVSGMVASVAGADKVLLLDGCPVACGKRAMDAAGLTGYSYVVVTELGVEKKHVFQWDKGQFAKALDVCKKVLTE